MIQCPKCSAENSDDSRFCKSCAEPLCSLSQAPTVAAPEADSPPAPAQSPHVGRIVSSDSVPAGGFTPGTILADRYRIIGLLGRGGMGEVYRADDLKLGQPVALKFLPPKLSDDAVRRERFFAEVRITRQLSHPNICRVYDIGEVDGRHFLSMEYIDGEDLASLMKRIGHLSNEKALDIARQLVAGLTVAHERGVLHRDLKPANIMLDGHGRVRITDFGLAIAVGDESQAEEIAGTPAYMAPEQLAGKGATVRSDIYSLGLILYEIYTGKKAFKTNTLAELREQKETQTPRAPSEIREGIDPIVERVIQRCMEKDPNARPTSVAQLAQALPGGDPLAAAIAAGETPSPEMVAASGSREGLRPLIAWALLAFILVGTITALVMKDRNALHQRMPFEKSPQELVERSHEILKKVGILEEDTDSAYGFEVNEIYLAKSVKTAELWTRLGSKAILFWYRQSPHSLGISELTLGTTSTDNPPLKYPGEVLVKLDTEGRLVSLQSVPPEVQIDAESPRQPDWEILFMEAGLDPSQWSPAETQWSPKFYADTVDAWQGFLTGWPTDPVRIEATAVQGRVVSFKILGPWISPLQEEPLQPSTRERFRNIVSGLFWVVLIGGSLFLARRNLRLGRGDRRSAMRLAIIVLALSVLTWIFRLPNVAGYDLSLSFITAMATWLTYMAIEPIARRRWPKILVSWTRLLSGNWRDPLIGRDVLVGCVFGILIICISEFVGNVLLQWIGQTEFTQPAMFSMETVLGGRFYISSFSDSMINPLIIGPTLICLLVVMVILLRNQKVAIVACILVLALINIQANIWSMLSALIEPVVFYFALMRFGLLAFVFIIFPFMIIGNYPTTLDVSAWYAPYGFVTLAIFATIVLYAFRTSLGGRPMFGTPQLAD